MTIETELRALSDKDFDTFFASVPLRVQMLVRGKMVAWQEVLPQYYSEYKKLAHINR